MTPNENAELQMDSVLLKHKNYKRRVSNALDSSY